jgi:radical SAM protein with 4Fe4S-binding SPASM domain
MQLPSYLQLEPVGQCNLRCPMCPIQFRQDGPPHGPPAFMPFDTFTRLVCQFEGLETLHLQGLGEPLMHPRIFDMVEYASHRGIRVTTNSNLTLLNERKAEACIRSGLDCLHVSIDGADAAQYERIRVRGHFERVIHNVQLINQAKRRLHSETPRLHLVMVLMRSNLAQLPGLVRLGAELEMEEVFVQHLCHDFAESSLPEVYKPMRDFVDAETVLGEDPELVQEAFEAGRRAAAASGIGLRLPPLSIQKYTAETPGRERCDWPWTGAYISYDGHSMPCCMISTPDRLSFGNVAERPFVEVWDGDEYQTFRQSLASSRPPEVCASCSIYHGSF